MGRCNARYDEMLREPVGPLLEALGGDGPALPSRRQKSLAEPIESPLLPFIDGGALSPPLPAGADSNPDVSTRDTSFAICDGQFDSISGGNDESQPELGMSWYPNRKNAFGATCRQDQVRNLIARVARIVFLK